LLRGPTIAGVVPHSTSVAVAFGCEGNLGVAAAVGVAWAVSLLLLLLLVLLLLLLLPVVDDDEDEQADEPWLLLLLLLLLLL
jgi:hypothetical protein